MEIIKKEIFLIDLAKKEDRKRFLQEKKSDGRLSSFTFNELYRISPKIKRYVMIDRRRGILMPGTNSNICPMGKYTAECVSVTGGAITLDEYFAIDTVLRQSVCHSTQYILKWDRQLIDMLERDGFKFWHRPWFGMKGRTHNLITVNTMNQTINDSAPVGSENISLEKFIKIYNEAKNSN